MSLDNIDIQEEVNKWSVRLDFQDCLGAKRKEYLNKKPFPHVTIDDFLPSFLAEAVHDTFPALDDPIWEDKGSHFQVTGGVASKYELGHIGSFPQPIRTAFEEFLFCPKFVDFVSTVTGIPDLYADQELKGGSLSGGLNAVEKGGLLVRHADFNFSKELKMYRAVNVLLYLNKDWSVEDGGNLDLWDRDLVGPPKTVISRLNRCLIFATNSDTYHGYERVLTDRTRKSINLYLYTKEPSPEVEAIPRKTDWRPVLT